MYISIICQVIPNTCQNVYILKKKMYKWFLMFSFWILHPPKMFDTLNLWLEEEKTSKIANINKV